MHLTSGSVSPPFLSIYHSFSPINQYHHFGIDKKSPSPCRDSRANTAWLKSLIKWKGRETADFPFIPIWPATDSESQKNLNHRGIWIFLSNWDWLLIWNMSPGLAWLMKGEVLQDILTDRVCTIHRVPSPCPCGEPLNHVMCNSFRNSPSCSYFIYIIKVMKTRGNTKLTPLPLSFAL